MDAYLYLQSHVINSILQTTRVIDIEGSTEYVLFSTGSQLCIRTMLTNIYPPTSKCKDWCKEPEVTLNKTWPCPQGAHKLIRLLWTHINKIKPGEYRNRMKKQNAIGMLSHTDLFNLKDPNASRRQEPVKIGF